VNDSIVGICIIVGALLLIGGVWRLFKAVALMMEAKARHWNALAATEEQKSKK
jgi:hypothetical protein